MSAEETAEALAQPEQDSDPPVARNQRRPLQRAANWDRAAEMLSADTYSTAATTGGRCIKVRSTIPFHELEIIKSIGEGSFGRVYLGKWCDTLVAVKLFFGSGINDSDMENLENLVENPEAAAELAVSLSHPILHNLHVEADLMATLRHPNIVGFLGICAMPPCVVSEYCSRGSLYDVLREAKALPTKAAQLTWRRRINMALDVAQGMLYLHQRSPPIRLRNLKSPNLLMDEHWTVKVSDFRHAEIMEDTCSVSSMAANNPRWMAPEVLDGDRESLASDVFSFGVVLWELLTFETPWPRHNQWQVMKMVTLGKRLQLPEHSAMPKESQGFVGLEAYEALVHKCWAEDPAARPTFSEIVSDLRDLLSLALEQDAQRPQA